MSSKSPELSDNMEKQRTAAIRSTS